ncbi:hypothetical protein Y032_0322g2441 [Ancylostoma ceylanicum]|uniref:Uncharacterized protein n=1 Tax=Ancylostoma ceylanicum TaxID=53326 RepID=A0A016S1D7_9BILA|nr:hypothetical protein Y032_0322g2441 [Ancylostoma ceylanicum]
MFSQEATDKRWQKGYLQQESKAKCLHKIMNICTRETEQFNRIGRPRTRQCHRPSFSPFLELDPSMHQTPQAFLKKWIVLENEQL